MYAARPVEILLTLASDRRAGGPGGRTETGMEEALNDRRQRVERAVREWVHQLMDLTGRNQLLYYRDLKLGTLDLS